MERVIRVDSTNSLAVYGYTDAMDLAKPVLWLVVLIGLFVALFAFVGDQISIQRFF